MLSLASHVFHSSICQPIWCIQLIDEEAFLGAGSLKILSLRNNLLCFGACEPAPDIPPKPIVFQHLPHLEVLDIWYNSQVTDYASNMCENLSNLKELYLDAPVRRYNSGFLALTKLKTLSLRGMISAISNDTFEFLRSSHIEKLDLGGCLIDFFDDGAFQFVKSLTWLSVANNPLHRSGIISMARGFSLISLQHLDLSGIIDKDERDLIDDLSVYACQWGSKLKSLNVSNNRIQNLGYN